MPIITISKEFASGGQEIGKKVAELLNIDYFDREIVKAVASRTNVSEVEVDLYEEDRHDRMQVFFSRVIDPIITRENLKESFPLLPAVEEKKRKGEIKTKKRFVPYACEANGWLDSDIYQEMVQAFIEELSKKKINVVIAGRGGQCILKNKKNCLHVRIAAPLEDRIERAIKVKNVDPKKAKKIVTEIDERRHAYIKHYYKEDARDPNLYHIIINSSRVGIDKAAQWIVELSKTV